MKSSRLFRYLWRIDAVFIFLVCVLVVGMFGYVLVDIGKEATERFHSQWKQDAPVERGPEIGEFTRVNGTGVVRARLQYPDRVTRNFLFYAPTSKTSHWLVAHNDFAFLRTEELVETADGKKADQPVLGFLYEVLDTDTNGDQMITWSDRRSLALSDPDGRRYAVLKTGIEKIEGTWMLSPTDLFVLYKIGNELRSAEISLPTHTVTHDESVPRSSGPRKRS